MLFHDATTVGTKNSFISSFVKYKARNITIYLYAKTATQKIQAHGKFLDLFILHNYGLLYIVYIRFISGVNVVAFFAL